MTEQGGLSQLARIQQQLLGGLEGLANLPAELSQLTAAWTSCARAATGSPPARGNPKKARSRSTPPAAPGRGRSQPQRRAHRTERRSGPARQRPGQAHERRCAARGRPRQANERRCAARGRPRQANERRCALAGGLGKLTNGNTQLANGLGRLAAGDTQLASGLSAGDSHAGALAAGLGQAQAPLRSYATMLGGYRQDYRLLHAQAPNALDSGYLVLTALDGTVSPMREQVAQLVNVNGGGQAARIMVVASSPPAPRRPRLSAVDCAAACPRSPRRPAPTSRSARRSTYWTTRTRTRPVSHGWCSRWRSSRCSR